MSQNIKNSPPEQRISAIAVVDTQQALPPKRRFSELLAERISINVEIQLDKVFIAIGIAIGIIVAAVRAPELIAKIAVSWFLN